MFDDDGELPKDHAGYAAMLQRARQNQGQGEGENLNHRQFFENKHPTGLRGNITVIGDNEDAEFFSKPMDERAERQSVRRIIRMGDTVANALTARVPDVTGVNVMRVTWDQYARMKDDPAFQSFAQYSRHITHYTDGRPRERPIRPFLEHEMGMYQDRIVVLANNPGDGARTGTMLGYAPPPKPAIEIVEASRPRDEILEVKGDPFPSPFQIIKGGQ